MKTNPKLAVIRLLSRAAAKGDTVWVEDGWTEPTILGLLLLVK